MGEPQNAKKRNNKTMKRTLRMFGLMLCTILLCVGFTACGDDDDDDNNEPGLHQL